MVAYGLELSPVHSVLIEESVIGWKEYEMEVMRDGADNAVIVCSIENFDPMGVHTGDSITVAPAQTLTDKEYQRMRDASLAILRKIGVETGGSNVQFAINPKTGRMIVIEMNPRVSRSQRPGEQGDRVPDRQDRRQAGRRLSGSTRSATTSPARPPPASSRRSTTSSPRSRAGRSRSSPRPTPSLTTQMKSVGEVMAIGRTFRESFQKALRGPGGRPVRARLRQEGPLGHRRSSRPRTRSRRSWPRPTPSGSGTSATRCWPGMSIEQIHELTGIDPWFLANLAASWSQLEGRLRAAGSLEEAERRPDPRGQAGRLLRPPARAPLGRRPRPRSAATAQRRGIKAVVQAGRHLRRRVRGGHAVLLLDLRGRGRGAASATSRG